MKKQHYITSVILLILPVIVIYALTNYGIEDPPAEKENGAETAPRSEAPCHKKQSRAKGGNDLTYYHGK
ncbi:MAG TPA: hypothetical protein VKN36_09275 [Eudoraea sp.]|nr:hypothetical protein [Eudoraea sp.]